MAGPAVAAAALVLSASFAMLMISPQIADIGSAVAAGVLISAFINAFLLVPTPSGPTTSRKPRGTR